MSNEIDAIRAEFKTLRDHSGISATRQDWYRAVQDLLVSRSIPCSFATPMQWLEAARDATTECDRCSGTGDYRWGSQTYDITMKTWKSAHSGVCFRCEGKGKQNQDDYRRNYIHTLYMISSAV